MMKCDCVRVVKSQSDTDEEQGSKLTISLMDWVSFVSCPILGVILRRLALAIFFISGWPLTAAMGPALSFCDRKSVSDGMYLKWQGQPSMSCERSPSPLQP